LWSAYDLKGLHHAVKTISDLMKCSAMDLYNAADRLGRKD
jgi:hypothetical protein